MRVHLPLSLLAIGSLFMASAPAASAVPYKVEVCTRASTAVDGIPSTAGQGIETALIGGTGPIFVNGCDVGAPETGAVHQGTTGGSAALNSEGFWRLHAPGGARILSLELTQAFRHTTPSFLRWIFFTGGGRVLYQYTDDGRLFFPPEERVNYEINSSTVEGSLFCPNFGGPFCTGGEFVITFQDLVAVLDDEGPPSFIGPPSLPGGLLRGTADVQYAAFEAGSGIASAGLIVDGEPQPIVHDDNGGRCHEPYKYVVPCRPTVNSSLPLDTTRLSDGEHQVRVTVVDATGQEAVSAPLTFTVHNAPVNTSRPVIRGTEAVGGQLTVEPGDWAGAPTAFAYQWLRCPGAVGAVADASGCVPIPGATGQEYAAGKADLGQRELVEVTATNGSGSGSATSVASEVISNPPTRHAKPPVLSHVTLSRKRFRVGASPVSSGRGAILSFSSSKAGHLSLVIERARGKGKPKPISKLAAAIKSGRSSVLLSGEIGKRRLPPGGYRITLRVRDDKGLASEPVSVPFKILPG